MQTKNIYLLVGESGNGKTSVSEKLEKSYGLKSIQSYTTRPKRNENEHGHVFVTEEQFDQLLGLVAYTKFNGYRYGTTTKQIDQNSLYVIDPDGFTYFKNHYKGKKKAFVIYIFAPIKERIIRMKNRGDTDTQIIQRVMNDFDAFKNVNKISNITIVNNDLNHCTQECYNYIQKEERKNE